MTLPNCLLTFETALPETAGTKLVQGTLRLTIIGDGSFAVRASSGRAPQVYGDYWTRGRAPCPPTNEVMGRLSLNLSWVKPSDAQAGAMGSRFYPVTSESADPNVMYSLKLPRRTRVGIGLHYDENYEGAPGSAGCIVALPRSVHEVEAGKPGWKYLMRKLDELTSRGLTSIPLEVHYTRLG